MSVLATRVFLDPYASQGIRSAIGRESRRFLSEEAFAEHRTRPRRGILVAELADHLPGFARLAHGQTLPFLPPESRAAELSRPYVQRPFLGQGLGKELLTRRSTKLLGRPAS